MKKIILPLIGLAFLFSPISAPNVNAQAVMTTADAQARIDAINRISLQIAALSAQLNGIQNEQQTRFLEIVRTLGIGSRGDDVKVLQALLAADASIYPEGLITGYFGPATARAVARFQARNGLPQVGRVGPMTLARLSAAMQANPVAIDQTRNNQPCAIVPPGRLIASGWLRQNLGIQIVPQCQTLPAGIEQKLSGFADTTAPRISSLTHLLLSSNANPTLAWGTSEPTTSRIYFSTTSPVNLSTASSVTSNAMSMSHTVTLTNLLPNTTYYYVVESRDAAGNVTTSAQQSFNTGTISTGTTSVNLSANQPVATVSGIAITNVGNTGATLNFNTSAAGTPRIYFSASSPVNLATAAQINGTVSGTNQSLNFTNLAPNTTYYYVIESRDVNGSIIRSPELSFTTSSTGTVNAISGVNVSNLSNSGATVNFNTALSGTSRVFFSNSCPLNLATASTVSGTASGTSQSLNLSNLSANTTYCYVVETTGANGAIIRSPEFTFFTSASGQANNFSGVNVSNISSNGAIVNFNGNFSFASAPRVLFSSSCPLNVGTASNVTSSTSTSNQALSLSNLSANTTYCYVIEARDASGAIIRSPEFTFSTATSGGGTVTTNPNYFYGINSSAAGNTGAQIIFNTITPGTARVYYGTVNPLNVSSAASVSDTTYGSTHTVSLSNLSANTTYYFILESTDANGNVTRSAQQTFFTTNSQ